MPEEPIRLDSTSWTGEIDVSDAGPLPFTKPPSRLTLWVLCGIVFLSSLLQLSEAIQTGYISGRRGEVGFYEDPGTFSAIFLICTLLMVSTGAIMVRGAWREWGSRIAK